MILPQRQGNISHNLDTQVAQLQSIPWQSCFSYFIEYDVA